MPHLGRSKLPVVAAGILALVALAAFLILDRAGGSVGASSLPVIEIGGVTDATGQSSAPTTSPSQAPGQAGQTPGQTPGQTVGQPSPPGSTGLTSGEAGETSTTTSGGSTSTASTLRETVNGGFHTGGTWYGGSSTTTGSTQTSGGGQGLRNTSTTGGR